MKKKPRDKERLEHILEAAQNIQEFSSGVTYEEYQENKMLQYAIVKNFEIIGEAAYNLTKELREKTEDRIEWRKIMAFRHILVHDYWMIDYETV
jgi:uncharacterized protein with HEPN domain